MRLSSTLRLIAAAAFLLATGCADTAEIDAQPAAEVKPAAVAEAPADAVPAEPAAAGDRWVVQSDASSIGFLGAKVTNTHSGGFSEFSGEAVIVDGKPASTSFTVQMASLWADRENPEEGSGPYKLTGHLKSPDFFDVGAHPTASFNSTKIEAADGDNAYTVTGNLEMRGKANEVSFPATITVAPDTVKADASFKFNRQNWGISYPGKPDDLIKDDVALTLNFTLTK
jgi:polyisoprenoid-binding protein YceI